MDAPLPKVCLLAAPETSPSVLYGLLDVLGTVGAAYDQMTGGEDGDPLLDVSIVAARPQAFRCAGGVLVEPAHGIDEIGSTTAAVVCDMYQPIDRPPRGLYGAEIAWLRRVHGSGAIIASVCSGSLLLAEAGMLDGLDAAGHWAYRNLFAEHYPGVRFRPESVLCLAGEQDRIVTAGSVSSWQELAVYLVARLCGAEQARRTAKVHLLGDRSAGQLPFAEMSRRLQDGDAVVRDSQRWIALNYACANPVARMTERAGLGTRTFARRFRAATGCTPIRYVHEIRIGVARRLLESSDDGVEAIGLAVGYEDPNSFRRLFKRETGLTPAAYRRKFAGAAAGSLR